MKNHIPENIVCFANLVGLENAYFASLSSFGFYRQLKVDEIIKLNDGDYKVKKVWSREQQIFKKS